MVKDKFKQSKKTTKTPLWIYARKVLKVITEFMLLFCYLAGAAILLYKARLLNDASYTIAQDPIEIYIALGVATLLIGQLINRGETNSPKDRPTTIQQDIRLPPVS